MGNAITNKLKLTENEFKARFLSLPSRMGDIALRFIDGNFRAQGYQGTSFIRWAVRKAQTKKNKGRAILVGSGRMRRGFRKQVRGSAEVAIINDTVYADVHNAGLRSGRGAGFDMPKRQMVPIEPNDSPVLVNALRRDIINQLQMFK
jgi:phage gpG-like protein